MTHLIQEDKHYYSKMSNKKLADSQMMLSSQHSSSTVNDTPSIHGPLIHRVHYDQVSYAVTMFTNNSSANASVASERKAKTCWNFERKGYCRFSNKCGFYHEHGRGCNICKSINHWARECPDRRTRSESRDRQDYKRQRTNFSGGYRYNSPARNYSPKSALKDTSSSSIRPATPSRNN